MTNRLAVFAAACLLTSVAGCGGSSTSSSGSDLDAMADLLDANVDANKQFDADAAAAEDKARRDAATAKARQLQAEGATAVTTEDMKRGQSLKGGGYLSTTLRAGIVAEQKLNLYQVQHALNLYNAQHGHNPRSHEEFMKEIIEFNGIPLEPLEEPYEYWYNAEEGELYKRVKPETQEAAEETIADSEAESSAP